MKGLHNTAKIKCSIMKMVMPNHRTFQCNTQYNTEGNPFLLLLLTLLRVSNIYLPLIFEKIQHSQNYVINSEFELIIISMT